MLMDLDLDFSIEFVFVLHSLLSSSPNNARKNACALQSASPRLADVKQKFSYDRTDGRKLKTKFLGETFSPSSAPLKRGHHHLLWIVWVPCLRASSTFVDRF